VFSRLKELKVEKLLEGRVDIAGVGSSILPTPTIQKPAKLQSWRVF
jgi:hypothetical protein